MIREKFILFQLIMVTYLKTISIFFIFMEQRPAENMKLDELKEKIDDAGLSTIQANAASDIITRCPEGGCYLGCSGGCYEACNSGCAYGCATSSVTNK